MTLLSQTFVGHRNSVVWAFILLTWELPTSVAAVMPMCAASIKEMLIRKGFRNKPGSHEDKPN